VIEVSQYTSSSPLSGGAEFYNTTDVSDENFDSFSIVHVNGNTSGLNINLGPDGSSAPTYISKDFYLNRPEVFTTNTEDELCPSELDDGILALIGLDPSTVATPTNGNGSNSSSANDDTPAVPTGNAPSSGSQVSPLPPADSSEDDTLPPAGDPVESAPSSDTGTGPDGTLSQDGSVHPDSPAAGCSLSKSNFSKNNQGSVLLLIFTLSMLFQIGPRLKS
jgi:hypothetical protein